MHPSPTDSPPPDPAFLQPFSIRNRVIEGSLMLVGLRWGMRTLNVIRTIVLARLLAPTDFGIFGMALLAIQPIQLLTAMDLDLALIRHRSTLRTHFDTAWTCRALQRLTVALCLVLVAPLAADYFSTPALTAVVRAVAVAVAIAAFENIGVVTFRQDLDFRREFTFNAVAALSTLMLTIAAAMAMRNYWALVLGVVAERLVSTTLSYALHPFRPRFSLSAVRDLWSFGQWIPVQNIGLFVRGNLDAFLIARLFGATKMGLYNVAGGAAGLAAELLAPVSTTLLPGYAKLAHDPNRLAHAYIDALAMLALLFVPATTGIVLVAPSFVPVVLGANWVPAVPIVQALALYNGVNGLSTTVGNVLMALGRMRRLTAIIYAQLLLYAPVLVAAALLSDPRGIAVSRAAVAGLVAPLLFGALIAVSPVRVRDLGGALWRPCVASILMAATIILVQHLLPRHSLLPLCVQVAAGVASYGTAVVLLWLAAGRPVGAEHTAIEWFTERARTHRHAIPS